MLLPLLALLASLSSPPAGTSFPDRAAVEAAMKCFSPIVIDEGGDVLREIGDAGFEPAIWVAPFIAEEGSVVFREHPDWFIRGPDGAPLRSDTVSFGGWRHGPWYCLDGTHPAVQAHFRDLFTTMREEWGCTYFKLDVNFWGMRHGGTFHDPDATRVEAYRRGMAAILEGTKTPSCSGATTLCGRPSGSSTARARPWT